jgi:hypothetical protein
MNLLATASFLHDMESFANQWFAAGHGVHQLLGKIFFQSDYLFEE